MSDVVRRWHEEWLGLVQPVDGLVVSIPVLVVAQCQQRLPSSAQQQLRELTGSEEGPPLIDDLPTFLEQVLGWTADMLASGDALPEELRLYVPEGRQLLRPSLAFLKPPDPETDAELPDDLTPAARAGAAYEILLWDLPEGLPLDKPETVTGPWDYPPSAKFDRLLRHCRVPIGLLTNRRELRLVYAPHGESSGSITFRLEHMVEPGGRPILDAFVMLLSAQRLLSVAEDRALPALLLESRRRQADVTNDLSGQIREALELLLAGFQAAAERDGTTQALDHALAADSDGLYDGLLTVLLRLVFLLYAEERGLLPTEHRVFAEHYSLFALFDRLQADAGHHPDTMASRHGAWGQLLSLFRAVYLGVCHGDLVLPARRGALFDPQRFPFLEGWGPGGSAPIGQADQRSATRTPTVDDGTVHAVLSRLLYLGGQRLSYRALDVEQIGSVYEGLMGWRIERRYRPSVCLRPARVWASADEVLAIKPAQRVRWLKDECGLPKAQATKLADALKGCDEERALEVLAGAAVRGSGRAGAGKLVLQPGPERRRTSSHYTPRSLAEPVVATTLEPLLAALGDEPRSEQILDLKVCDPAMGSGAFLVAACRWLGDRLVAAWTREGRLGASAAPADGEPGAEPLADSDDPVLLARRLVAQRCLYGVDKNAPAVHLAKLSLWLVTMSRELPFTFVDHALRHGDAMVGLSFEQLRAFHWAPQGQQELVSAAVDAALDEAIALRQGIHELADDQSPAAWREKEGLLRDADDALDRVRLVGDLVVGAFFAESKAKARTQERDRRLTMVAAWLSSDEPPTDELLALRDELRRDVPAFHWMLEFPEVFYDGRPDPLSAEAGSEPAYLDALVGNPPFVRGKSISTQMGPAYADWLQLLHKTNKNADISAHFFRRASALLGEHGAVGLIATNSICEGDTRRAGLKHLVETGATIYSAVRSQQWPGEASVAYSLVHLAFGSAGDGLVGGCCIDGRRCSAIDSRLRVGIERNEPETLASNVGLSFQGCVLVGVSGFTMSPVERSELLARSPRSRERLFPYLGGDEVCSSPRQEFERYTIDFGGMDLEQAAQWPELLEIVREQVKPGRDRSKRKAYKTRWWQFGERQVALYEALTPLERCLVTGCAASKHLLMSWQPVGRVFSNGLFVFPLDTATALAVLQSRIHERWARLVSSSMRSDLRYAATDCFETFPFPAPDPRTVHLELEDIGERLDAARSAYMVATDQGLTKSYNQLKDPDCRDPRVEALRALHVELDQRVLAAYGWDIEVPPFTEPRRAAELATFEAFENEVLDRLFVLNAERAVEEKAAGAVAGKQGKAKTTRKARPKKASRQDRDQAQLFDPGGPEAS